MSAVIVKCNKCGNDRESYNDPRRSKSVIECKAKCHESHYEWTYVSGGGDDAASRDPNSEEGAKEEDYRKVANALYIPPGAKLNNTDSADEARASLEKEQAAKKRQQQEEDERREKQKVADSKNKKVDEEKKDCGCTLM